MQRSGEGVRLDVEGDDRALDARALEPEQQVAQHRCRVKVQQPEAEAASARGAPRSDARGADDEGRTSKARMAGLAVS